MSEKLKKMEYTVDHADHFLTRLFSYWGSVDELVELWKEMDELQQIDEFYETAIPNSNFSIITRWHEEGKLTPAQEARYTELLALIAEKKPIRDRLLELDD